MWKAIVITKEEVVMEEAREIRRAIEAGAWRVHIRHPRASEEEVRRVVEGLDLESRRRVVIHDWYDLADEYGLAGKHLNMRNIARAKECGSVSCHTIEEVRRAKESGMEYCLLSPIFDSISKRGYRAGFAMEELRAAKASGVIDESVVAMGGVCGDNLRIVRELGFGGVAMIGAAWRGERVDVEVIERVSLGGGL